MISSDDVWRSPTQHDVRHLQDAAFAIPRRWATGAFDEFLAETFAAFMDRIADFDDELGKVVETRRSALTTLIAMRSSGHGDPCKEGIAPMR